MTQRSLVRRAASLTRRKLASATLRLHRRLAPQPAPKALKPPAKKKPTNNKPTKAEPLPVGVPPVPASAEVYRDVAKQSLFLAGIRHGAAPPAVSLAIPAVQPDKIFAGIATALQAARLMALELDRPLRVVPFGKAAPEALAASIREFLSADGAPVPQISVVPQPLLAHTTVSPEDVWVVTYWTTAHAAVVACRSGVLDPQRVVYLIQDYEPGFHPWSVPHALTRQTYHAGFHHLINSSSLARYLAEHEGSESDQGLVFAPHLEVDRLMEVATSRLVSPTVRVLFYARPGKPRNLYELGVAALRDASLRLEHEQIAWEAVTAGESHPDLVLPTGAVVPALGKLSWDGYFDQLSRTDVGLSLMHSPHPSHPPLEIAISGGLAVTNDLDGVRGNFHNRITAVDADPAELATALVEAIRQAASAGPQPYAPPADQALGRPLPEVVTELLSRLP